MRLWSPYAWLGGDEPVADVLLSIDADRVAAVTAGVPAPADAERLDGLLLPGLANAHSHAFQRALRGRTEREPGSFWSWRRQMYSLAGALDPDSMLALSRAAFGEMALAGITVVGEFHYVHHRPGGGQYSDPNAMASAVIEAAREAGVRLTLLDACYLDGGLEPDPVQERFFDANAEAWISRVELLQGGPVVRIGAAVHSMRAVQPEAAAVVAAWAASRSLPLHAHVSEQPAENQACLEVYGATPVELFHFEGALPERFTAVHATHVTERDIELLGEARACCCLCPTTERSLADGIGPARALREAGCALTIGTDSNGVIEPFEEVRAVELDERLGTGVRSGVSGGALLAGATTEGYRSLGWDSGGAIREGALADLVSVATDGVRLAGTPSRDLIDAAVFAGGAADVRDVVVGGRFVVRDGAHVSLDVPRELASALSGAGW
ncbi:MAG TPA: formimidoylglutamate deiminase [Solirubrobacteraceae bacterium]